MKAAIIGGGISGLSIAQMLKAAGCEVRVFEKASAPGGLVKCSHVNGQGKRIRGLSCGIAS